MNDVNEQINNKKLEVKNTVYLNKEKIEKLQSYKFGKIKLILILIIIIAGIVGYFNDFIGLSLAILTISIVLLVMVFVLEFYIKATIKKLQKQIRNLELYFKELDYN